MPWSNAGQQALPQLSGLLGLSGNPADMQNYLQKLPGYQFTLGQGLESVQNGFAARGLGTSGAALKGAANYATGLANNTYQSQVANLQNYANMGSNAAAGVGSNLIQAGNAQASGLLGAANSIGNAGLTYGLLNSASAGGGGLTPPSFSAPSYATNYLLPNGAPYA